MTHRYHGDLVGIVLYDGCDECEARARDWGWMSAIDNNNLKTLAQLAEFGPDKTEVMSWADRKAIDNLRYMGRVVFASGITEEVCR